MFGMFGSQGQPAVILGECCAEHSAEHGAEHGVSLFGRHDADEPPWDDPEPEPGDLDFASFEDDLEVD